MTREDEDAREAGWKAVFQSAIDRGETVPGVQIVRGRIKYTMQDFNSGTEEYNRLRGNSACSDSSAS